MQGEKQQWPEVVGKSVEEASNIIKTDDPEIQLQILPEGSPTTRDYRLNRVRIFHNADNIVTSVPRRG